MLEAETSSSNQINIQGIPGHIRRGGRDLGHQAPGFVATLAVDDFGGVDAFGGVAGVDDEL